MRERENRNEERGRKRRKVFARVGISNAGSPVGELCQKFLLTATYIVQSYDDVFKRAVVYVGVGKVARVKRRLVSASRFSLQLSLSVCKVEFTLFSTILSRDGGKFMRSKCTHSRELYTLSSRIFNWFRGIEMAITPRDPIKVLRRDNLIGT